MIGIDGPNGAGTRNNIMPGDDCVGGKVGRGGGGGWDKAGLGTDSVPSGRSSGQSDSSSPIDDVMATVGGLFKQGLDLFGLGGGGGGGGKEGGGGGGILDGIMSLFGGGGGGGGGLGGIVKMVAGFFGI